MTTGTWSTTTRFGDQHGRSDSPVKCGERLSRRLDGICGDGHFDQLPAGVALEHGVGVLLGGGHVAPYMHDGTFMSLALLCKTIIGHI